MITIKDLTEKATIGQRIAGLTLFVKTRKKHWQVNDVWWQQIIVMDETGEMPADVKLGKDEKYRPYVKCDKLINCIVTIQEAEYLAKDRKKLVVEQFEYEKGPAEPDLSPFKMWQAGMEPPQVVRGKIMCWLVAAYIQSGKWIEWESIPRFAKSKELKKTVDRIMEG
jgi:hypothetical protein